LDDFNEWSKLYETERLTDLKRVSDWKFSSEAQQRFFDFSSIELGVNYEAFYVDKRNGELDLNEWEINILKKNDCNLSLEARKEATRGIDTVISRLELIFEEKDNYDDAMISNGGDEVSDVAKRGIFFHQTVADISQAVLTKLSIGVSVKLCVIGVWNVVSLCRLINEFDESGFSNSTLFEFTIIECVEVKQNDVKFILENSNLKNTKFKFLNDNFLLIPNENFQDYNCVLCFLHQSCTSIFALKYILLQLYTSKGQNGLQLVLASKKVRSILCILCI
jgi:hypothetical protein